MSEQESQPLLRGNSEYRLQSYENSTRSLTRRFLASKYGHYAVLFLVSVDVSCIFADFLISLHICEHVCQRDGTVSDVFTKAQDALGIISLVFSCLFMVELMASIWAFGVSFFKSKFRCFDAAVILASFIIDVCLKGVLQEAGSVLVVLRLFRTVKIIDELSAGASEQMETLEQETKNLKAENEQLQRELASMKAQKR